MCQGRQQHSDRTLPCNDERRPPRERAKTWNKSIDSDESSSRWKKEEVLWRKREKNNEGRDARKWAIRPRKVDGPMRTKGQSPNGTRSQQYASERQDTDAASQTGRRPRETVGRTRIRHTTAFT